MCPCLPVCAGGLQEDLGLTYAVDDFGDRGYHFGIVMELSFR
jgi:hypothetical protein